MLEVVEIRVLDEPGFGSSVDGELMPWSILDAFLDEDGDLRAVYAYLTEVSAETAN